jgi:hypothetical protein
MRIFMTMRRCSGPAESGDALLADMKKAPEGAFFAELRWPPKWPKGIRMCGERRLRSLCHRNRR